MMATYMSSTPPRKRTLDRRDSTEPLSVPKHRRRTKSPCSSPLRGQELVVDKDTKAQILQPLDPNPIKPNSDCTSAPPELPGPQTSSADLQEDVFPLVGRESECAVLESFLQRTLGDSTPAERCLYMSGGPGTGKTCSARAAVRRLSKTHVFEVNCMDLPQRSVAGCSDQLAQKCVESLGGNTADHARCRVARQASPIGAAVEALRMIKRPTVIIVDEVDQLVPRGSRSSVSAGDLDDLFSLTRQPGVPPMAIIVIANAVDLLTRANLGVGQCASLLFEPYNKDQLRQIAMARLDKLDNIATLDRGSLEVRVRQVAKQSGDCRQVVAMCEEAKFKSATATGPVKLSTKRQDPLDSVSRLPMDQQLLLCVLAGSESEAVKVADVCSRYKQMCRKLHQPINLANSGNVNIALCQLEQYGLLSMRKAKGAQVAELSVTRDRVRDNIDPLFKRFFS